MDLDYVDLGLVEVIGLPKAACSSATASSTPLLWLRLPCGLTNQSRKCSEVYLDCSPTAIYFLLCLIGKLNSIPACRCTSAKQHPHVGTASDADAAHSIVIRAPAINLPCAD